MPRVGTLVFCICISLVGIPSLGLPALDPLIAASQFNLLPVFEPDGNGFSGLSLVNTSAVSNEVTVTWTASDGKDTRTARLSLARGAQRAALLSEIFGVPEDPAQGWLRIDSSQPGLLSYLTSGREGVLDGTESASVISTRITLPHVDVNTGFMELEYADTLVSLVNPGSAAANVRAELIGLDGVIAGEIPVSIAARASRTLRVSEAFRDVLPANGVGGRTFRGYMKISSDVGLAAWLRIDTPLSRSLLRGPGAEEILSARLAVASHFAFGSSALYHSELNFVNTGASTVTLDLAAQIDNSRFSARRTLGPGQGLREDVISLFGVAVPAVFPPLMLTGYIRIQAADGGMFQGIGDVAIARGTHVASMLYPVEAGSPSRVTMPFAVNDSDYFTGYAIANPNDLLTVQTEVTIELFDTDGHSVGLPRTVSLSPSARFAGLVEEKVRSGYLQIRANGPIVVQGSIGTGNGSVLASLPALP